MADATANVILQTRPRAGRDAFQIGDGTTVYEGILVGLKSGYVEHWDDTATNLFLGIVLGGDDRADDGVLLGETDDTPPPEARIDTSGVILMHLDSVGGTPAQAKVGDPVYCNTSNTDDLTLTASSAITEPVGILWRFRSTTDVDVMLLTPAEHMAQRE